MQNPELFACLSKERKENLLGTLLFRPSIYERLYYEEEMVRKQIVCYEEFLQNAVLRVWLHEVPAAADENLSWRNAHHGKQQ